MTSSLHNDFFCCFCFACVLQLFNIQQFKWKKTQGTNTRCSGESGIMVEDESSCSQMFDDEPEPFQNTALLASTGGGVEPQMQHSQPCILLVTWHETILFALLFKLFLPTLCLTVKATAAAAVHMAAARTVSWCLGWCHWKTKHSEKSFVVQQKEKWMKQQ